MINIDKSGVRGWICGGVVLRYISPSAGVTELSASSGCGLGPVSNWSEIDCRYRQRKKCRWIPGFKGDCLKRAGLSCALCTSLILNGLSVVPLHGDRRLALERFLSSLLWRGLKSMVCRQVCCQHLGNGMTDLECYRPLERLAFLVRSITGDAVYGCTLEVAFSNLKSNIEAEIRRWPSGETSYLLKCRKALCKLHRSSDILQHRKVQYQELVEDSVSDQLVVGRG